MIRVLTTADHEAFRETRGLGLAAHPVAFATMADAWRRATPEQTLAPLVTSEGESDSCVLGAFEGESLVGLIGFRREARASLSHKGSLWGLFVKAPHRRRGVGRALLDEAIATARQAGLRQLRLVTATTSTEAIGLFESAGFLRYGLERDSIRDGDAFYDQAYMALALEA